MGAITPSIYKTMLRERKENYYNVYSRNFKELQLNDRVRVQIENSNKWDRCGIIIEIGKYRKYLVYLSNGREVCRNRKFLRLDHTNHRNLGNKTSHQEKNQPV